MHYKSLKNKVFFDPSDDVIEKYELVEIEESEFKELLEYKQALSLDQLSDRKRREIEVARKADEADGVTINGVRYSGSPENRQSLADALELASEEGITEIAPWKDSDDAFHVSVSVNDVRQARSQIIKRRAVLISQEEERFAAIDAALAAEDRAAIEAVEW